MAQACECTGGRSGVECELEPGCGVRDSTGECCGDDGVLTVHDRCCSGAAPGVSPVLDINGDCCASGTLNACGECDGDTRAVVSWTGSCCRAGVTDAEGVCCDSGAVDAFGVCDGDDSSGSAAVTIVLRVVVQPGGDGTDATLHDDASSQRRDVDDWLRQWFAAALNRTTDDIVVQGFALSSDGNRRRRALQATQLTTSTADIAVESSLLLLPCGAANNIAAASLQSALLAVLPGMPPSPPLLAVQLSPSRLNSFVVTASSPSPVCGNAVCEVGERPEAAAGAVGCASDCRTVASDCSSSDGAVCSGRGICVSGVEGDAAAGAATCVCHSAQGWAGPLCDTCRVGFVASRSPAGLTCRRVQPSSVECGGHVYPSGAVCSDVRTAHRCAVVRPLDDTDGAGDSTCVPCPRGCVCPNVTMALPTAGTMMRPAPSCVSVPCRRVTV
jgi:hypothetical protein